MPDATASFTADAAGADIAPADDGPAAASRARPASSDLDGAQAQAAAQRVFSMALLVSAVRCLLTYLVLPFAAPALGFATGVGPAVGLSVGAVAIVANGFSIRRFHRACHRWRWPYTALASGVIALLLVTMAADLIDLL